MTDRELLEAAAKAAGYEVNLLGDDPRSWYRFDTPEKLHWNPLTNDGDALRLAVKLRLSLTASKHGAHATGSIGYEPYGDDPYAATRRCIVRAAAAMSESKA